MPSSNNILLKIRGFLPSFNPALRKIAEFILENPHEIKLMRVKDLAARCDISEATVIRFVQAIGLSGYQEMKIILAEITSEKPFESEFVYNDVTSGDSIDNIIKTIFLNLNTTVDDTKTLIESGALEKAIETLHRAEKVDIYGAGGSFVSAEAVADSLFKDNSTKVEAAELVIFDTDSKFYEAQEEDKE